MLIVIGKNMGLFHCAYFSCRVDPHKSLVELIKRVFPFVKRYKVGRSMLQDLLACNAMF